MILNELGNCPKCKRSWAGNNIRIDLDYKQMRGVKPYSNMGVLELQDWIKAHFTPPYFYSKLINTRSGHKKCPYCKHLFI